MAFRSVHAKILTGWVIITVVGLSSFVVSKRSIDARRYESMKSRKRMRDSNLGEYESERKLFAD